jgi:hypothetical protein
MRGIFGLVLLPFLIMAWSLQHQQRSHNPFISSLLVPRRNTMTRRRLLAREMASIIYTIARLFRASCRDAAEVAVPDFSAAMIEVECLQPADFYQSRIYLQAHNGLDSDVGTIYFESARNNCSI